VPLNLADPAGGGASTAFWKALFPHLANVSDLAFYHDPSGAVAPLVLDANGATVNTANFPNILADGNVAPWMYVNNNPRATRPAACAPATNHGLLFLHGHASPATDTGVNPGTVAAIR